MCKEGKDGSIKLQRAEFKDSTIIRSVHVADISLQQLTWQASVGASRRTQNLHTLATWGWALSSTRGKGEAKIGADIYNQMSLSLLVLCFYIVLHFENTVSYKNPWYIFMCKLQQAYPPIVHVGVRVEDRKPAVVHMLNICSICLCTAPPRCEQTSNKYYRAA